MKEDNFLNDMDYVPSKYSKAFYQYGKTQIKFVMPFLTSIAQTCHFGHQFPVCKVLKAVSKFFLLNEIQVIFLAYIIRQTNWDIKERVISTYAENIQDIVCYSNNNPNYKRTILYLMVSAYTVKYYLNKNTSEALEEASKRCPNFKYIFENWAKKYSSVATKINPRTLNTVYKHLYCDVRREKKDFNLIVDAILQISPAYNPEKDKTKKQDKKKNNQIHQQQIKNETLMLKHDKLGYIAGHDHFFREVERVFNTSGSHKKKEMEAKETNLNPFMPFKADNNKYSFNPLENINYDAREECDFGISCVEGVSENLEGRERNEEDMGTIGLNRGISITEKYLASEAKVNQNEQEKKSR